MKKELILSRQNKSMPKGLFVIVILFILSAISIGFLIYQRIAITLKEFRPGVFISLLIFLLYFFFLLLSIIMILAKKKNAIKISIITAVLAIVSSFWYSVLGQIIFYVGENKLEILLIGLISFIINLLIALVIIFYLRNLLRSKNLKKIKK